MGIKFFPKEKIHDLPKGPGVYLFKNRGEILYIGKASNLRERVKHHFQQPTFKDYLFLDKVKKIGWILTDSEIEALILESQLIKKYNPKFNTIWRDDKNYFFIGATKEDFPRIFLTHQKKFKSQTSNLNIEYIGPFVDGKALKQTLKVLRKIFPFRSCYKIPNRPCLWYHLNYCLAPCLLRSKTIKEIPENSLKIREMSQKNAENLIKILKEGKKSVLKNLKREMKAAVKNQDFEEAAKIRDQIRALEKVLAHAKIFEPSLMPHQKNYNQTEKQLKEILKTKNRILRIEGYDISNIGGKEAAGSLVVFFGGLAFKNFYRRFKIKFSKKPNDVAMIKELLTRRFKHLEWGLPDLILIDGGRAQLNIAQKVVKSKFPEIKIIALAKKENKLFVEDKKEPILLKNLPREIFNLILQIRDEAHRFALSYHKKLRKKVLLKK